MELQREFSLAALGVLAQCGDLTAEIAFWCNALGFSLVTEQDGLAELRNQGLRLFLRKKKDVPATVAGCFAGIEHIALRSTDIDGDLCRCSSGIAKCGDYTSPSYNPKVWGKGTRYFNLYTPSRAVVEICQRIDEPPTAEPFSGLSHIGIPVSDYEKAAEFYQSLGFCLNHEVLNQSAEQGRIRCGIFDAPPLCLELYQFLDAEKPAFEPNPFYYGLLLHCRELKRLHGILCKGYEQVSPLRSTADGQQMCTLTAPDGVCIVFTQADSFQQI